MSLAEIDLIDGRNFVAGVPHEWFAELRREAPVFWHPQESAPRGGFWAVTRHDDCVHVNRDWEHFSSTRRSSLFVDVDDDQLAQQRLMMLNMDPTMHTRYRRLVNHGFTPKMVAIWSGRSTAMPRASSTRCASVGLRTSSSRWPPSSRSS